MTHNMEGCWINTKAITRNTTKMHRIRWTVENFSQIPFNEKIFGPDFKPTISCSCNIFFQKWRNYILIYLHNKSGRAVKVKSNLALLDSAGTELYAENTEKVINLPLHSDCNTIAEVPQEKYFNFLKDDVIIIDCFLNVIGNITTAISFSESGRESRNNLVNDLRTMYNNPIDSDFTLQVGDEIIYTHKALLRARCAYFKRMLEADMKESKENSVSITDVSHPTLLKLVEFLYTGDFTEDNDDDIQQISDLYFAADKYEVMILRDLCADKLISMATAENICRILQLSQCLNDEDLKLRAMDFISYHFDEVEKSTSWKTLISRKLELASEVLTFCFKRLR